MNRAPLAAILFMFVFAVIGEARAQPKRLLVIGDSLSSGYNIPLRTSFPFALSRRLHAQGYRDVAVLDAAEAGDTTQDALARLPSAFAYGADAVIVELGGNDMLQHLDPSEVYRNLDAIVRYSKWRGARVILAGMLSYPRRDPTYKPRFDAVYPALAANDRVPLYPFFLDGVFGNPWLIQRDGKHPNPFGAAFMAARMAPMVERTLRSLDNPPRRRFARR